MSKIYLGATGVDSGQLFISDPCYIKMDKPNDTISYDEMCQYGDRPSKQLINKFGAEVGVVVPTTIGDGVYPVYGKYNKKGQLKQIIIDI
jgi:hypothetical protein